MTAMVSITEVRAANSSLHTQTPDLALTAVFVGATSGIGLVTLRAFAQHIPHPTAIIVGRSKTRFATHLEDLRTINPNGVYEFIEHDIELIKDIDATTQLISQALSRIVGGEGGKIDLLYQSQGYISFSGRQPNADGLDTSISLRYHGRVRFTQNLLPFMAPNARVVSILAGTQEGKIFEDDLGLERNYSIPNSMSHFGSLMTLAYDDIASQHPQKTFVHAFPGLVSTGLLGNSATGILGMLFRWVVEPFLATFVAARPEEVGERMLYYGTAETIGGGGKGQCVAVDEKGEVKENEALRGYRERRFARKVGEWERGIVERATAAA